MSNQQEAFLEANPGKLTPEQAAQYLDLGEGDTATAEKDNKPEVVAASGQDAEVVKDGQAQPVLLAKDGVHTIDYQKLVDAREDARLWKAKAEQLESGYEALKAEAQERANAGQAPTVVDGVIAAAEEAGFTAEQADELFGDYSAEAMLKAVTIIGKAQVEARVKLLDEKYEAKLNELTKVVKPLAEKLTVSDTDLHFKTIHDRHPDASSIAESKELADWISSQPSFLQAGIKAVLEQGTAQEVIELIDTFKSATTTQKIDYQAAAKSAIAKVQNAAPMSITDIPGGRMGAASKHEAMANMSPANLADALEGMTQEQVDAYLNRSM